MHSCQQFEFSLKVKVMRSNPGYPLKSFLLYTSEMCCCILRNSQSARKLILFSDCFSLLFQLLVFFLLPGIFALTTPLGIFAHIAPEKVCAVSVRKTVKLSTMGHFLVLHTPNVHGPDHLLLIWPKQSRQMTSPETRANSVQRTYQKLG